MDFLNYRDQSVSVAFEESAAGRRDAGADAGRSV